MAEELRWEVLAASGTTVSVDSAAEFRNDSSVDIHIRDLKSHSAILTAANDEFAFAQLSKSPIFQGGNNQNPFFGLTDVISNVVGTTGSGADDVAVAGQGTHNKYAKGQLTLEPGESLFLNTNVTGTPTVQNRWSIGYHF